MRSLSRLHTACVSSALRSTVGIGMSSLRFQVASRSLSSSTVILKSPAFSKGDTDTTANAAAAELDEEADVDGNEEDDSVPDRRRMQVPELRYDISSPQVYSRIRRQLASSMDVTIGINSTPDHIEALRRAQAAVRNGTFRPIDGSNTNRLFQGFIDRLIADGGDKVHIVEQDICFSFCRFLDVCASIKGLSLNDALLELAWNQRPIGKRMKEALDSFIVLAKEDGFDLKNTYVAEAFVRQNKAIVSEQLMQKYLRGRGRYGSTPHIKSALLEVVLQERNRPFDIRLNDPLEWIRVRLRKRYEGVVDDAETVYLKRRQERPIKPIYC
eukprot:jgi/Hompol1/101/HPOL_004067-RA